MCGINELWRIKVVSEVRLNGSFSRQLTEIFFDCCLTAVDNALKSKMLRSDSSFIYSHDDRGDDFLMFSAFRIVSVLASATTEAI